MQALQYFGLHHIMKDENGLGSCLKRALRDVARIYLIVIPLFLNSIAMGIPQSVEYIRRLNTRLIEESAGVIIPPLHWA